MGDCPCIPSSQSLLRGSTVAQQSTLNDSKRSHSQKVGKKGELNDELAIGQAARHYLQQGSIPMALQPMVMLETEEAFGFEALARPLTAEGAPIPPLHFITLIEHMGLMVQIGELLMLSAFAVARQEQLAPRGLELSLNISPCQFAHRGLADRLVATAKQFQMPMELLNVEITETALVTNERVLKDEITSLRDHGVKVSLDDFGTGLSNLNRLRELPADAVKIDGSFTTALTEQRSRVIMASLANMCRDLGLDAVVEGIETEAQRARLQELGFQKGQGYLFGKPKSISVVSEPPITRNNRVPDATGLRASTS